MGGWVQSLVGVVLLGGSVQSVVVPERVFVCGLGYVGLRAAKAFRAAYPTCSVAGCVRSREKAATLRDAFPWLETHVFDLDEGYSGLDVRGATSLRGASHVVETVAPLADGDEDPLLALHGGDVPRDAWVGYLSSTGVYGDHGGDWIDESAETRGADRKSLARLVAEAKYLGRGATVFRLGGIYGPGRSLLDAARAAPARPRAAGKYVNRILADDVAACLVAAAAKDLRGHVVNVVDDEPASRREVLAFARTLTGAPEEASSAGTGPPKAARSTGSKRCKNDKLKTFYELSAPTYRQGLEAIHTEAAREAGRRDAERRRNARIQGAKDALQSVALMDQREEVQGGDAYWMRDKYEAVQRILASEEDT